MITQSFCGLKEIQQSPMTLVAGTDLDLAPEGMAISWEIPRVLSGVPHETLRGVFCALFSWHRLVAF